jgi:hypothetical protein
MTYSEREFGASQSDYEPKEQQMSDIVERLDRIVLDCGASDHSFIMRTCADASERLRANHAAVVEAIENVFLARGCNELMKDIRTAIRALKGGAA